jgi:hypothetical protein
MIVRRHPRVFRHSLLDLRVRVVKAAWTFVTKTTIHGGIAKRVFVFAALEVIDGMGWGMVAKQDFGPGEVLLDDGDAQGTPWGRPAF